MRSYRDELLNVAEQLAAQGAELDALNRSLDELQAEGCVRLPGSVLVELEQVFDNARSAPGPSLRGFPRGLRA